MTDDTKQPPKAKTKDQADLENLQKLVNQMSPATRDKLARAGVTIPEGDITSLANSQYKWGYRCTKCNKIALYFVGDRWTMHGKVHDVPPQLPHYEIAWTQNLPPSEISRNAPDCQHCRAPLPLNADDSFDRARQRIVNLTEWQESRDVRYDSQAARKTVGEAAKVAATADKALSGSYNLPKEKASETINRLAGGENVAGQIELVAAETGATAALNSGFKQQ